MSTTVKVKSADDDVRMRRKAVAQRVLAYLGDELPDSRLLCFFDDEDWQALKAKRGIANRGFYEHIRKGHLPLWWSESPNHLREALMVDGEVAFSDLIYVHGSTCSNEVGLTMTFAHELQHFIQHGTVLGLWAANTLIPNLPKDVITALGLTWCDVPFEREARIVSKRATEELFGAEVTSQYIEAKITQFVTKDDAADWECVNRLVASAPYDLAGETRTLFLQLKPYRGELERALRGRQHDPDFRHVDLRKLLDGATL
jgi:hypothetical protein